MAIRIYTNNVIIAGDINAHIQRIGLAAVHFIHHHQLVVSRVLRFLYTAFTSCVGMR